MSFYKNSQNLLK